MSKGSVSKTVVSVLAIIAVIFCVIFGVVFGIAIASTKNIIATENFTTFDPALPSRLVDCEGRLITEFASDEKRELISIKDMPQHLIDALITREDRAFWTHPGFTLRGYFRAFLGIITKKSLGGGSTLTLQLAGTLYADRTDISIKRKLIELWWGIQLERRYSKQEILEMYMNRMIMGPGVYGVEAASKYFFGHSAKDVTIEEAALLVIQLSSPTRYNPIRNPNVARERSREVLDQMIEFGYVSKEDADNSFDDYWNNYDYTRIATASYNNREDKAPWFSEYVRRQLDDLLYGSVDLYKDGLTIHTTLNLDYQELADKYMNRALEQSNAEYAYTSSRRLKEAELLYAPMAEMLGLAFNLESIFFQGTKIKSQAIDYYRKTLNPTIDALSLVLGVDGLKPAINASYGDSKKELEKNTVEGALITIENETGYIKAIVGGSKFDQSNQLIRATQAKVMPGSSFKPIYFSAGIDSRNFTPGTLMYDVPMVFHGDDGSTYFPKNYGGAWNGPVLLHRALAKSLNIPALKLIDGIGFNAAIDRSAALLGITDPEEIRKTFPRFYPLALGIISISPLQMARAFAIFGNQGREVTPIAIRSIEDRNGDIFLDNEATVRKQQQEKGSEIQVISPQNAYVMTQMLKETLTIGTLYNATNGGKTFTYSDKNGKSFIMPAAGKTGTTQNWADAWSIGYTPYMTTSVWFGFDRPGNSLGISQSGAAVAGNVWSKFMKDIHEGLPYKDFVRPSDGIVEVTVCSKSGLLPTEFCKGERITLTYLAGTQPRNYCDLHQAVTEQEISGVNNLQKEDSVLNPTTEIDSSLDFNSSDLDSLLNNLINTDYDSLTPGTEEPTNLEDLVNEQEPEAYPEEAAPAENP